MVRINFDWKTPILWAMRFQPCQSILANFMVLIIQFFFEYFTSEESFDKLRTPSEEKTCFTLKKSVDKGGGGG